jgi:hydroxyacylglutathione hydrolase
MARPPTTLTARPPGRHGSTGNCGRGVSADRTPLTASNPRPKITPARDALAAATGHPMKISRKYLFPRVIELSLAAGRPFGVNIYLIDGGTEYALLDIGLLGTLDEVIDTLRGMDFPLSKCKLVIATHADADHAQALAAARDRLKAKAAAHPRAAKALETGDPIETFATISAQNFSIPMPPCKIDVLLKDGDEIAVGDRTLTVWSTPGHTPGQLSFKMGNLLFSGDNIFKDGSVGVIDAHHGSSIPSFLGSLNRILADDAEYLLPSHGPAFRKDPAILNQAIDRLTGYQYLADFGTCALGWPLQEEWEKDVLAGKMPDL